MQGPGLEDQNSESFDFVRYISLLWHWAWLILLAAVIAGGIALFVSKLIPPVYQAETTILVDMAPSNKSIDYSTLQLNSQLTQTYSQMLTKSALLDEVATRLGLAKLDPKTVIAKPVTSTQLISIQAKSTNPQQATAIANTLVAAFSEQVQSLQTNRYSASEESLQAQMTDVSNQIEQANAELAAATDQAEIDRLETTIANYRQTYANLLQSYEQVRMAAAQTYSAIVQIEPAVVPIKPISPRTLLNVGVAAIVGAIVTSCLIIGIDVLNDTTKSPEEISYRLKKQVMGVLPHYRHENGELITEVQPLSPVTEAFRTLRTNVIYAGPRTDKPPQSIMVISATPGEGKTEVLANLGVVFAQNGSKVLLLDADLRRPNLHKRLGLDNSIGLSQILRHPELGVSYTIQPTRVNKMAAITSGDSPPNPAELLGLHLMGLLLKGLKSNYDVVLIDTPPALAVTDAAVILPYVEAVILVIKPGNAQMASLRRVIKQFSQFEGKLLGIVLNDINMRNSSYGYYYKNYKYDNSYRGGDGSARHKKSNSRS